MKVVDATLSFELDEPIVHDGIVATKVTAYFWGAGWASQPIHDLTFHGEGNDLWVVYARDLHPDYAVPLFEVAERAMSAMLAEVQR